MPQIFISGNKRHTERNITKTTHKVNIARGRDAYT